MVDYTKDPGTSRGIAIYLIAGLVVLVLLYAVFVGGGTSSVGETGVIAPEAEDAPAIITD